MGVQNSYVKFGWNLGILRIAEVEAERDDSLIWPSISWEKSACRGFVNCPIPQTPTLAFVVQNKLISRINYFFRICYSNIKFFFAYLNNDILETVFNTISECVQDRIKVFVGHRFVSIIVEQIIFMALCITFVFEFWRPPFLIFELCRPTFPRRPYVLFLIWLMVNLAMR